MAARKKAAREKSTARKRGARKGGEVGNGLKKFSLHALDPESAASMASLRDERPTSRAFGIAGLAATAEVDPETAARRYLEQTLESPAVTGLSAPRLEGLESEFRSIGTETIPLTNTKTVKFRQTVEKVPVYGSLVTVELDDNNDLVGLTSSIAEPKGVSPVAKVSPSDAIRAARQYGGYQKQLDKVVPRLHYYFEKARSKWRLVFILEDVRVKPKGAKKDTDSRVARKMDYVVDAHSGKVVAELPRTPTVAPTVETAVDGLGRNRQIGVVTSGGGSLLQDTTLNVQTFDFRFADPEVDSSRLPGQAIKRPPAFPSGAVSAHANAAAVASFLRNVVKRNNIDNQGGPMRSTINCVVARESRDGREWFNAFWNGDQMVYGQRRSGQGLLSLSVALDVVGHEMFHGVTDSTSRLEYAGQSGALNESYSDIYGLSVANFANADPRTWSWLIGQGLSPDGNAFRDASNPAAFDQPDHMGQFRHLPNTRQGDYGGVHVNSGIHNKAAYNIFTATHPGGGLILTPTEVIISFYLALTQRLSRTSQFADSRAAVLDSARTLLRNEPPAMRDPKIAAIDVGFRAVGIT